MGKATWGRKRMDNIMARRDYGHLKDWTPERSRWRQYNKLENMSGTCSKQQKTKEEEDMIIKTQFNFVSL